MTCRALGLFRTCALRIAEVSMGEGVRTWFLGLQEDVQVSLFGEFLDLLHKRPRIAERGLQRQLVEGRVD